MGVIAAAQYTEYYFLQEELSKRYGHAIAKFYDKKIWKKGAS